ncbi:hypothetical protein AWB75_02387 [Caballeronia catudaia]|uniref:Uncharacterized protein n=1 Tax=Caballeronia catudaia TaxID=1777136 RepID=A0A158ALE2_9BURK|nr:hypothetical protein AWB75_02387 [Caballeronia catudaia]
MLAFSAFTIAARLAMDMPRPPVPRAMIVPVLVIVPGDASSETMPCALPPDTSIVPLFVMTLLPGPFTIPPLASMPCADVPVVAIEPLLMSVSPPVRAPIPLEFEPLVTIVPSLVSAPPPGLLKSFIAVAFAPLVVSEPPASLRMMTAAALLNIASELKPAVDTTPRFTSVLRPNAVLCEVIPSKLSPVTCSVPLFVAVLVSRTNSPLRLMMSSSAPGRTLIVTLTLPGTAMTDKVDGLGKRVSHVAVTPDWGALLSHAPNVGSARKRQETPNASESACASGVDRTGRNERRMTSPAMRTVSI